MWLILLPLPVAVVVGIFWLLWQGSYWQRSGIRGPTGWPLVGSMWQFVLGRSSYGDIYARIYNDHPGMRYVGIYRLFNEPALLVRDEQMLRELLVGGSFACCGDNAVYVDAERDPLAIHNPFLACGKQWRQVRGELVPLFTPHRLRQALPHIIAGCRQLQPFVAQRLAAGVDFEAKQLATRYTLQVVASAAFGLNAQCLEPEEGEHSDSEWLSLLGPLFQPSGWSLAETIALLHAPRLGWLLQHRYVPLKIQEWIRRQVEGRNDAANTLLSWLRGNHSCHLAAHATTLLMEGYETSAMLLAFALHELARNPSVQQHVQAELDETAGRHDGELLRPEALEALPYTEATLYETLRLHPAMPALMKRCTEPIQLPDQCPGDAGPQTALWLPKNTVVIVPVQALHLDATLYEQPSSFKPERFMQQHHIGCRFLGFGAGPRMCPGMRFGLAQTKAALSTLLRTYNVKLAKVEHQPMQKSNVTFLTSTKRGVWLRLEARPQQE